MATDMADKDLVYWTAAGEEAGGFLVAEVGARVVATVAYTRKVGQGVESRMSMPHFSGQGNPRAVPPVCGRRYEEEEAGPAPGHGGGAGEAKLVGQS